MKQKFRKKNDSWLKLDNAALVYPSASNGAWNNVVRVSAYLKEDIDPKILQKALETVIDRFPHLDVTLRRGMFWHYFQNMQTFPKVQQETTYPCRTMELNKKKHLFRVLYYKNKVSFEIFHALTDGKGAVCFLNSLIACYLVLTGKQISTEQLEADFKDRPNPEELEDSFRRYADDSGKAPRNTKKAYQVHGTPEQNGKLDVITAVMQADKLKEKAKEKNCTITQLLVAVYAKCLINYQKQLIAKKKPVVINVPINLRRFFDTKTLRNFSSWLDVIVDGKDKTENLDELINLVKTQMSSITKENMIKNINANIGAEKNFFVRIMPLFIKNIALHISYKLFGENSYTTVLTNLGNVNAPKEFDEYVERYDVLLCKSLINTINVAVITHNNKLSLTITSCIKEKTIEKNLIAILESMGLDITIYTNLK